MADPFDIVIFGGAGDLAFRKLVPALYRAYREEKLAPGSRVIAVCHKREDAAGSVAKIAAALQEHLAEGAFSADAWEQFKTFLFPLVLDISVVDEQWQSLTALLNAEPEKARAEPVCPALYQPDL